MKRSLCVLLCLLFPCVSLAANAWAVGKRVEASMVVTGSIVVAPDGSVHSYSLDKQDKLPSAVVGIIGRTIPIWKFQPVLMLDSHNRLELAKTSMSLRVVASPLPNGSCAVSVNGASFESGDSQSNQDISWKERDFPLGVAKEAQNGLSGTVYLTMKVNREGRVAAVEVTQINLRAVASDSQMDAWRRSLGRLATRAANSWTFNFPQAGKEATTDYLLVRVPLNFDPGGPLAYGQWDAYVPGPVQPIPWANEQKQHTASNGSGDAIPDNGAPFVQNARFVLLTPLGTDEATQPQCPGKV